MKKFKKLAGLVLAMIMVMAMAVTSFAAPEGTLTGGKITINNAVDGQEYKAYQILYLESYSGTAFSYKANSTWATWLETQTTYVAIDTQGYVTWVAGADAAEFAKAAQQYAQENSIAANAIATASGTTVEMSGLNLGYYLVDTSLGTLCSLNTTATEVTIEEKNTVPTIDKKVQEDSDSSWESANTAQIGDTVNFKTTVQAKKGAQNYKVYDKMSEGFTLKADTIAVKVGGTALTADTDYTLSTTESGYSFVITFVQTYLNSITADTGIEITYSAILNDKAVISTDKNTNKTKLTYGEKNTSTTEVETETTTFSFNIIKTNATNNLLNGAKFELYDAETDGSKIALVKDGSDYRVATETEKSVSGFTSAVIEAGKVTVKGLDANTSYWLEETQAPDGYNKLAGRQEVKMTDSNNTTTMTESTWTAGDGGVHIVNNSGTELPSTGGIGTTIFYAAGAVLVLGAAILLVAKKRMSNE